MNNNSVVNIDGTPYRAKGTELSPLIDAVTHISIIKIDKLLGDKNGKNNLRNSEKTVNNFLAQTKIQANLLNGNYQTGVKLIAPVFFSAEGKLSELPYLNILVALLARLKKQTNSKYPIKQVDRNISLLDEIVNRFISKAGISPNDATSILSEFNIGGKTFKKKTS